MGKIGLEGKNAQKIPPPKNKKNWIKKEVAIIGDGRHCGEVQGFKE